MNHQTVTSRYRLARAAHHQRIRERRIFAIGLIAGIAFAALWVAL